MAVLPRDTTELNSPDAIFALALIVMGGPLELLHVVSLNYVVTAR